MEPLSVPAGNETTEGGEVRASQPPRSCWRPAWPGAEQTAKQIPGEPSQKPMVDVHISGEARQ